MLFVFKIFFHAISLFVHSFVRLLCFFVEFFIMGVAVARENKSKDEGVGGGGRGDADEGGAGKEEKGVGVGGGEGGRGGSGGGKDQQRRKGGEDGRGESGDKGRACGLNSYKITSRGPARRDPHYVSITLTEQGQSSPAKPG